MGATTETKWRETTTDADKSAGVRRFTKSLRNVQIEVLGLASDGSPPEDAFTDEFYDWLDRQAH